MTPLTKVETLKLVQLDMEREEGGYPRDSFVSGDLPPARKARLEMRWDEGRGVVVFVRVAGQVEKCVGVVPVTAISVMHPSGGLRSLNDSL